MIFCLPGLLLMNAAIIKHTASCMSLSQMVRLAGQPADWTGMALCCDRSCLHRVVPSCR
jgi:hypothetical protein